MRGDLAETPAVDVCRSLAATRAEGVLEIDGPAGVGALVWRAGTVVAATSPTPRSRLVDRLVGAGLLDADALRGHGADHDDPAALGEALVGRGLVSRDATRLVFQEQVLDAIFDVFGWSYGAYRFAPTDADAIRDVVALVSPLAVERLLDEVVHRQAGWRELARVIPDLDAVVRVTASAPGDPVLEPDELTVLTAARTTGTATDTAVGRRVRELADDLGYGRFETARIVHGLVKLGHLVVTAPQDEVGRALDEAMAVLADDRPRAHRHEPVSDPSSVVPTPEDAPPPADAPVVPTPEDTPPPADRPAREPRAPGEVAELLRELSQLAADDGPVAPATPPGRDGPDGERRSEPRPKRRRFGRG